MTRLLLCLCFALVACKSAPPEEFIDLGPLPPWTFTDETGKPFGSDQLQGRPWVANFLFTSCPTSCPPLARATAGLQTRVQKWLPEGPAPLAIVSVTVDPVTDTPAVLAEFGRKYGADPRIWKLVAGPYADMERLVTDGFMMPILRRDRPPSASRVNEDKTGTPPESPVTSRPTPLDTAHSLRFVLVDAKGHIRGLYDQTPASLDKLDAALQYLLH